MRPRALAPTLVITATLAVTACGSGGATIPAIPKGRLPDLTHRTALPTGYAPGARAKVAVGGLTLFVTVERVIDPLTGSGAKTPAGTTAVGVEIAVHNAGPATYDSSATSDFSLRTAAGPAQPVFAPSGSCETFVQDFMNELGPGAARSGCIAYAIPRAHSPTEVRFTPYGGHEGRAVTWRVGAG